MGMGAGDQYLLNLHTSENSVTAFETCCLHNIVHVCTIVHACGYNWWPHLKTPSYATVVRNMAIVAKL